MDEQKHNVGIFFIVTHCCQLSTVLKLLQSFSERDQQSAVEQVQASHSWNIELKKILNPKKAILFFLTAVFPLQAPTTSLEDEAMQSRISAVLAD